MILMDGKNDNDNLFEKTVYRMRSIKTIYKMKTKYKDESIIEFNPSKFNFSYNIFPLLWFHP